MSWARTACPERLREPACAPEILTKTGDYGLTAADGASSVVILCAWFARQRTLGGCGHSRLPTGSITVLLVWMSLARWALVLPGIGARRGATLESSARIRQLAHVHLDAICRTA